MFYVLQASVRGGSQFKTRGYVEELVHEANKKIIPPNVHIIFQKKQSFSSVYLVPHPKFSVKKISPPFISFKHPSHRIKCEKCLG